MKKKILIILMIFALIIPSEVILADSQDMKVQYLIDNDFVEGRTVDEHGVVDYALDRTITRAEVSKLVVHLLKLENLAEKLKGVMRPFDDVDNEHWANGYVSVITTRDENIANGKRLMVGYPDGKFLPEKPITYNELSIILVRLTKKDLTDEMEKNGNLYTSYMGWADELGLYEDLKNLDPNSEINRKEAFTMIYNALDILEKTDKNEVDFGEKLGIISKYQMGELILNNEEKYVVNNETLFSDGTYATDIFKNVDIVGSFVKIIADSQNRIKYISELGNPRDLAIEGRWHGIGEYLVESKDNTSFKDNHTESYIINVGDVEAEITKETRIFAADKKNNALTEVGALGELFEMYDPYRFPIEDVYMAYDKVGRNINEAKVIVFNSVEKFMGKEEIRRIINPINSNGVFTAESMIEHHIKPFTIADVEVFPNDFGLDYHDVVMIKFDNYDNARLKNPPIKLIDRSKDNIYEVEELDERSIVLKDEYGYIFPAEIGETAIFKREELEVGSFVQVVLMPPDFIISALGQENLMNMMNTGFDIKSIISSIDLKVLIDVISDIDSLRDFTFSVSVISVVDEGPRGTLPFGLRTESERGYVDSISGDTVTIVDIENGRKSNYRLYKVSGTALEKVEKAYNKNAEIVFDKSTEYGNTEYIYNVDYYLGLEKLAGAEIDDWIIKSIKNSVTFSWTSENLDLGYERFNDILSSKNPYPILFRDPKIINAAILSYNSSAIKMGKPIITLPDWYLENL